MPMILVVLACVVCMLSAFITAMLGVHAIFGAFVAGLCMPRRGDFHIHLMERIESYVGAVLLPCYFALSGV